MSSANVTFDAKKLLKSADALQLSNMRRAAKTTMRRLGFVLARDYLPKTMKDPRTGFDNPVPYTLRSVFYRTEGTRLTLSINQDEGKGNAPAKYLFPVEGERYIGQKEVYPTRFARALWSRGTIPKSLFPVPIASRVPQPASRGAFYRKVLRTISEDNPQWKTQRFFSKHQVRRTRRGKIYRGETGNDFGIYRVKASGAPEMIFKYVQGLPLVPQKWDFYGLSRIGASKYIGTLLALQLQKQGTTWGQKRFFEAKYQPVQVLSGVGSKALELGG